MKDKSQEKNRTPVKGLSLREENFCISYATIGSDTYSNGTKSAIDAGYSEKSAHSAAWRLLKKTKILQRNTEIQQEQMQRLNLNSDKVLADLEHVRCEALRKGELSNAIRASELQGKSLGMFGVGTLVLDVERERELTDAEQAEARRIAQIRLADTG